MMRAFCLHLTDKPISGPEIHCKTCCRNVDTVPPIRFYLRIIVTDGTRLQIKIFYFSKPTSVKGRIDVARTHVPDVTASLLHGKIHIHNDILILPATRDNPVVSLRLLIHNHRVVVFGISFKMCYLICRLFGVKRKGGKIFVRRSKSIFRLFRGESRNKFFRFSRRRRRNGVDSLFKRIFLIQ